MKTVEQSKHNYVGDEPTAKRSRFWAKGTPNEKIASDLEADGYTSEKAGDDFPRVLAAVRAMLDGEIDGLVLNGKTGCGKTTAAKSIARHALDMPILPAWDGGNGDDQTAFRHGLLVECAHQNEIVESAPDEDNPRRRLAWPTWNVMLDDMGSERPVVSYGNRIDPVAEYIHLWDESRERGRLLITTNLDAAGIKARYDDRVLSRLVDHCGWLAMSAPDHRLERLRKF